VQRSPDEHLSPGELDAVLRQRSGAGTGTVGPEEVGMDRVNVHLITCHDCRELVEMHVEEEARLGQLKVQEQAPRRSECPEPDVWPSVAAGLGEEKESKELLQHAAICDHCGPLLRYWVSTFSSDVTEDEEKMLRELESSGPEWQESVARQLSEQRESWWRRWGHRLADLYLRPFRWRNWILAGAAVAVVILLVIVQRQPSTDRLLANAYTKQRTFELRIAGAEYGPIRMLQTAADRSPLDRPPALLEAEARVARGLAETPSNPDLLQAKGRAELLHWNYVSAISAFNQAIAAKPDSQSLMTDLASAYFESAEANNRPGDYETALNLLTKALAANPNDTVALFNRAVVLQKMSADDRAIEDWHRYLQLDSKSTWAPEAKRRLDEIESKRSKPPG